MTEEEVKEKVSDLRYLYLRHCAKLIVEIWDKFGDLPDETYENLGIDELYERQFVCGYARAIEECSNSETTNFPELPQTLEVKPKSA